MVDIGSPQLPRLVEEVLSAGPLPAKILGLFSDIFRVSGEDDGALLM